MLTNENSAAAREIDSRSSEYGNSVVASAVSPKKAKSFLDVAAFKTAKAQNRDLSSGKFRQSGYPVKKPGSRDFFRVHPSGEHRLYGVTVLEDDEHVIHIVQANYVLPEDMERFAFNVTIFTCVTHKGVAFLWYIKESANEWSRSAYAVAKMATSQWVRTRPNMAASSYDTENAPEELSSLEPVWPELSFQEILNSAFEGRIVDSDDYPLIRQLQGRA